MQAKILKCTCKHKGQDALHGHNNRVFTPTTKSMGDSTVYRCTVCLKEKTPR